MISLETIGQRHLDEYCRSICVDQFILSIHMGKLAADKTSALSAKVEAFEKSLKEHIGNDPKEIWAYIHEKTNEIKSSTHETKFITLAAAMNLIAAMCQLIVGLWMKSLSVVSASVDSLLDFVLGMFNLFLLRESRQAKDTTHNYGYGKLQGFGALFQSFVIIFFGIVLAYFSIMKLINNAEVKGLGILIVVMLIDFIGGLLSVAYYFRYIKRSENVIVMGTLKKVYAGLLFNIGIMLGLFLIYVGTAYFHAKRYWIDPLIGLIVAGYILYAGGQLLRDGYGILMDRSLPAYEVKRIKEIIDSYEGEAFDSRKDLRTRSSGTVKFIDFTVFFDEKKKSFKQIYTTCVFLKGHIEQDIEHSVVTIVPKPI